MYLKPLTLLQEILDYSKTEHNYADTSYLKSFNVSTPAKCVIMKLIKALADDTETHLNLHKMAAKAKTDEIIFHSLNLCLMDKLK